MNRFDWYIGAGFLIFVLSLAGIIQDTTPGVQPMGPGLAFLAGIGFLLGIAFMGYGAAKSLTRGKTGS